VTNVPTTNVPPQAAPAVTPHPGVDGAGRPAHAWGRVPRPANFGDSLRAEWTKLRSVRSTWITLVLMVVVTIGLGALIAYGEASHYSRMGLEDRLRFDPVMTGFFGIFLSQLAACTLGVLVISNEYTSGMIRTTFQAVPRRTRVLAAKAVVYTAVILVLGEISSFATFFVVQPILKAGPAPYTTISQPGVLRAVFGAGLYLAATGLLALAIGALVRHTAGGIASIVGLLWVLPLVGQALPASWRNPIEEYLPSGAGQQIVSTITTPHTMAPWTGFGVLCLYVVGAMIAAFALLVKRDA
jgi:ABC-2 type transport system permease protein